MKKKYILRAVCAALLLAHLILIFVMSAMPATGSDEISMSIGYKIGKIIHPDFENWSIQEQRQYVNKLNKPIRKTAHFLEYALLGVLLLLFTFSFDLKLLFCGLITLGFGAVYAASDEIHQMFVSGRAFMVTDILIDTGGIIFGGAVTLLIIYLIKRKKSQKNKNESN